MILVGPRTSQAYSMELFRQQYLVPQAYLDQGALICSVVKGSLPEQEMWGFESLHDERVKAKFGP